MSGKMTIFCCAVVLHLGEYQAGEKKANNHVVTQVEWRSCAEQQPTVRKSSKLQFVSNILNTTDGQTGEFSSPNMAGSAFPEWTSFFRGTEPWVSLSRPPSKTACRTKSNSSVSNGQHNLSLLVSLSQMEKRKDWRERRKNAGVLNSPSLRAAAASATGRL